MNITIEETRLLLCVLNDVIMEQKPKGIKTKPLESLRDKFLKESNSKPIF